MLLPPRLLPDSLTHLEVTHLEVTHLKVGSLAGRPQVLVGGLLQRDWRLVNRRNWSISAWCLLG